MRISLSSTLHTAAAGFSSFCQRVHSFCSAIFYAIVQKISALTLPLFRHMRPLAHEAQNVPPLSLRRVTPQTTPRKGIVNAGNTCYLSSLMQAFASAQITQFRSDTSAGAALSSFLSSILDPKRSTPLPASFTQALVSTLQKSGWKTPRGEEGDPIDLFEFLQPHIYQFPMWDEKKGTRIAQQKAHVECAVRRLKQNTSIQEILDGSFNEKGLQHFAGKIPPAFFTVGIEGRLSTPRCETHVTASPTVQLSINQGGPIQYQLAAVVQYVPPNHYTCLEPHFDERNQIDRWVEYNDSQVDTHENSDIWTQKISLNGFFFIYSINKNSSLISSR